MGNGDWVSLLKTKYKKAPPTNVMRFWKAYAEDTALDPTKAGRVVGYRFPNTQGPRLVKKFPDVAEAAKVSWLDSCGVKPDELLKHLGEIVRDKDHKDRMKAIETNAKIHGMLSDKLILDMDKNSLLRQIDDRISQLLQAKVIESGHDVALLGDGDTKG